MTRARQQICYVDTGGTFTDAFVVDERGEFLVAKAPTTKRDLSIGFYGALAKAAGRADLSLDQFLAELEVLGFGTTVVINALLTRAGRKCGLIVTKGHEHLLQTGRGKAVWIDLDYVERIHTQSHVNPEPPIPRHLVKGVTERVDCFGRVVIPVYEEEARRAARELAAEGVEAIVVLTLWAFVNDANERRIAEIVREELGERVDVVEAAKVSPMIREFPRACSAFVEAYTGPLLERQVRALQADLWRRGFRKDLLIMQSMGGVAAAEHVLAVNTVQSGPVGGLIGGRFLGQLYGYPHLVTTDVGGTSFDVGLIVNGEFRINREPAVGKLLVSVPIAEIVSIGAGGGSLAGVDPLTGRLYVGPASAGADPGPAAYGRGGDRPTVTDADLILGYLDPEYFLGGEVRLDRRLAEAAIRTHVADPLGLSLDQAAAGIRELADTTMRELVAGSLVGKGYDVRDFVLLAFGGAGPTHVAGYTEGLALKEVLFFPYSAAFSAFGCACADIEQTQSLSISVVVPPRADEPELRSTGERLNAAWARLEDWTLDRMRRQGFERREVSLRHTAAVRYGRQLNDLIVQSPVARIREAGDLRKLLEAFEADYERVYTGSAKYPQAGYEIYEVGVTASVSKTKPRLVGHPVGPPEGAARALKGSRSAWFTGERRPVPVYAMEAMPPGSRAAGPCLIEGATTTAVIPPGCSGEVDAYLTFHLRRDGRPK
jgi:N-methylhydantoinase A